MATTTTRKIAFLHVDSQGYQNLTAALDRYLAAIQAPNSVRAQTQYNLLWVAD